jgi:nicotinate-nucleotide pyrophosphorylase (carboxylating)
MSVPPLSTLIIEPLVRAALIEDLGRAGDITTDAIVPGEARAETALVARAPGLVAGLDLALLAFRLIDPAIMATVRLPDGARVSSGDVIATVSGPARGILTAERVALNLLCHLSGVASLTAQWADALSGTGARVRDTRKTMPGLRALQKYAVRCGGGVNHRMSLSDAALVKDNHVAAIGGVAEAFAAVRSLAATIPVEIEVDDLAELGEAFAAGADLVMLDNFDVERMRAAVALRTELAPHVLLEASGGLTVADAAAVGATGVDFIAVGELTHSARVLDIGLDLLSRD